MTRGVLEQRVDEEPGLRSPQDHQNAEQRDRREDRHQPPHAVGLEEVEVLAQDAGPAGLSIPLAHQLCLPKPAASRGGTSISMLAFFLHASKSRASRFMPNRRSTDPRPAMTRT